MSNVYVKWLLIIGGLNWGLVGIGNLLSQDWDVVGLVLGGFWSGIIANLVFIIVGIAAVVGLFSGSKSASGMGTGNSGM